MSLSPGTLVYGFPNNNKISFIGIILRKSKKSDGKNLDKYNIKFCYQIFNINIGEIKTYHMANFCVYESEQNGYK